MDDGALCDDDTIGHRRLRSALELAVDVASQAAEHGEEYPDVLRPFLGKPRLAGHELGRVRRAVAGAPTFRATVAERADGRVDEIGQLWLERPPAWPERIQLLLRLEEEREQRLAAENAHHRERKRRESAERKRDRLTASAGQADDRFERLSDEVARLRRDVDARTAELVQLRDELAASRRKQRQAADRQQGAEQRRDELAVELERATQRASSAEAQRDELLAQRADAAGALSGHAVADVRRLADELRRTADRLHGLLTPAVQARTPLAIPGSIYGDGDAITEYYLRSGALLLVDGYNVAMLTWPEASLAEQRRLLLDALDNVARRYGTDTTVVFDGADVVGASADARRLIRVRYSPAGITADDVIRAEVAAAPSSRNVVVVTNDRAIQRDVARDGANVLASDAFRQIALR